MNTLFLDYDEEYLKTTSNLNINDIDYDFEEDFVDHIKYVKEYLNKDATITIGPLNLNTIKDVLDGIINNNINNNIIIKIEPNERVEFNRLCLDKLSNRNNITIELEEDKKYSIQEYLGYEKKLDELVESAKDMSPFEKYIYAYNVVKHYKEYKEANNGDMDGSRDLYKILDSEYMVCLGYSRLLEALLSRLGIKSRVIHPQVNIGFDGVDKDAIDINDKEPEVEGHARIQVLLEDPKYNIKGIYYADPTWDNGKVKDLYSFILMTSKEYNETYRENFISNNGDEEVLESNSIQEYYDRVNYFLNSMPIKYSNIKRNNINRHYDFIKDINPNYKSLENRIDFLLARDHNKGISNFYVGDLNRELFIKKIIINCNAYLRNAKENEIDGIINNEINKVMYDENNKNPYEAHEKLLDGILSYVEAFNPTMYQSIRNKYPEVFTKNKNKYLDAFKKVIEETSVFVTSMNNNKVPGSTLIKAIKKIYKVYYKEMDMEVSDTKIDEIVDGVRNLNERYYTDMHPKRLKVTDEDEEVIMNEENKFSR